MDIYDLIEFHRTVFKLVFYLFTANGPNCKRMTCRGNHIIATVQFRRGSTERVGKINCGVIIVETQWF